VTGREDGTEMTVRSTGLTVAGLSAERRGSGPPLLLLHGIGHRWQGWLPVLDGLSRQYDVVALDLPGFGDSPGLSGAITFDGLVDAVEKAMDELGWAKAHIAGNSLGGWISLELARRGRALSVTGIAPAGLWRRGSLQRHIKVLFAVWVNGGKVINKVPAVFNVALVRALALFPLFGKPWKIPAQEAKGDLRVFVRPVLGQTMDALEGLAFEGGIAPGIPVTIAWAQFDPLFQKRWGRMENLPPDTRVITLRGCGHVPMWDDPAAVTRAIVLTASAAV
jgi:pimeloyl-ACP methyl ester carboxylesterase